MGTLIQNNDFTKNLHWPGYRVYRHEIDERRKKLTLRVQRKRATGRSSAPVAGGSSVISTI